MALRGTLADFGLPDIFQLVGHQQKTGVLLLKDRELEVRISFVEGNVVKAEQSSRDRSELLGSLLVRGGVITNPQLEAALATQQRTLRRLGDILIEMGVADRPTIKEFARLQTTETIYRLFMWRKGTYEFTAAPVDYDEQSYEPIRAENLLMEGFRMVDEWPSVRKVVPSSRCSFVVLKDVPPQKQDDGGKEDLLAGMHEAFADESAEAPAPPPREVGSAERRVFPLVTPARTVQDIIDLSRLGEFETSKALATLVRTGYLRVVLPQVEEQKPDEEPFSLRRAWGGVAPVLIRVAVYAVVAAAIGGVVHLSSRMEGGLLASRAVVVRRAALQDETGDLARLKVERALEVFRLAEGRWPSTLDELLERGLVQERDLRFPYRERYAYRLAPAADGTQSAALALPLW
ncbi:MAG: DUF4388 domain-containing protein [Deltaproteobacteria bacterium]|nr:DUF4388 domain-containing protein [Deltaproteobacteria bacterium]